MSVLTRHLRSWVLATLALCATCVDLAQAQSDSQDETPALPPSEVRGLTVEEHVGFTLPLELTFQNEEGQLARLGEYFAKAAKDGGKPAVVMMVYYRCPVVCDVLMSKMTQTFEELDFTLGTDYQALFFSIDDRETPEVAARIKHRLFEVYRTKAAPDVREAASDAWRFHTGDESSIKQLASALGYQYRKLENGEFSHPVVAFVVTPDGKLSRYLYGFKQEARDLKLALMEASEGKLTRTVGERLLAFCYMFDPARGTYTLQAYRVMQVGAGLTLVALGTLVGVLLVGERLRKRALAAAATTTATIAATTNPTEPGQSLPETSRATWVRS